jgi:cytochrome P450
MTATNTRRRETAADEIVWNESGGFWAVRSQRLAVHMLRDHHLEVVQQPELATSQMPGGDEDLSLKEFFGSWFSRSPRHAEVRRELNPPYAVSAVGELEDLFRQTATQCLAGLPPSGDLMDDYFTPYGMLTTARMLDVPDDQWSTITKIITIITDFVKKPLARSFVATHAEVRAMETAIRYLRRLVEHLFAQPEPGPLVRALQQVAQAEGAGVWLAVAAIGQLFAAGVEPMTNGAGLACREIFARPAIEEALRSGRIGLDQVAEESLRLNPPFLFIHRWAQRPCGCLGTLIERGDHVVLNVRAVNRDPTVFDDPDEFRPERPRRLNMTFGRGIHTCLGIHSGRLQIAVALEALLGLEPSVRIDLERSEVVDIGYLINVPSIPFTRVATPDLTAPPGT